MKTKQIIDLGTKVIYNLDDGFSANDWVREKVTLNRDVIDSIPLSSALTTKRSKCGNSYSGNIGYFYNDSNAVKTNTTNVALFSSIFSAGQGVFVIPEINFDKVVALFTARKTITPNWINQRDEYSKPNKEILNEN